MSEILCRRAKELDLPLEYNLAGLRFRSVSKGWGYTSDEFWAIAAQYGCKAIIALDAHQPEVIGQVADIARGQREAGRPGYPGAGPAARTGLTGIRRSEHGTNH